MTAKIYTTARGKTVDMGALRLQNEHVRAVGNMGVNSRGDRIDANGQVIDPRQHQLQRQVQRQTNVSDTPVHKSTAEARQAQATPAVDPIIETPVITIPTPVVDTAAPAAALPVDPTDTFVPPEDFDEEPETDVPAVNPPPAIPEGGLAGAIAKAKTVKQELEKTPRQQQQAQGVRKL
jgi:hypothetical protein